MSTISGTVRYICEYQNYVQVNSIINNAMRDNKLKPKRKFVTNDEETLVILLYGEGLSAKDIADEVHKPKSTIYNILNSNGFCLGHYKNILDKRFGRLTVTEKNKTVRGAIFWKCRCDCGSTVVVRGSNLVRGVTKSCGCLTIEMMRGRQGDKNYRWKGGRIIKKAGYIYLYNPEHGNSGKNGYVGEHVFVMSEFLGRSLYKNEIVHHKNGIKGDNRIENLELLCKNKHIVGQRMIDVLDFCRDFVKKYEQDEKSLRRINNELPH